MKIGSGVTVLFQGDSITDSNRNRNRLADLGDGYVMMVAERFFARHNEANVSFVNRGISGNRIKDMRERWQEDCLSLKPDIVSILIGVNDSLGTFLWEEPAFIEIFEEDFISILNLTRKYLDAHIVLMEPFLLPLSKEQTILRKDLCERIKVIRKLAKEYETELIQLDSVFFEAAKSKPSRFWTTDGVHPTPAGHALIADAWLSKIDFT